MKHNKIIKQLRLPFVSLTAAGALYMIYFAVGGFYPFGERSIAWCDLEQQYIPLLMELRGIIKNGGSLLLGRGGGGMNLWGVILFFVSSPLNLLSVLVSADKMIHFINILTILKLALSAGAFSLYLERIFNKLSCGFNIMLSVTYSFSGYAMMYYQNNMWLDMMIIFPLLMMSLFRLCESGRWKAYALTLSLAMLLNFYISYMVVLFIVTAFGAMLFLCCKKEKRRDAGAKFLMADLCAALMTAVIWLPSLKQFSLSGRGESSLELFRTGSFFEDFSDKLALLGCTSIILAAAVLCIVNRKQFAKGRAAFFGGGTLLMLAAAFVSPINKIWHTGSYQAYPLRYGFILILLGLSSAAVLLSGDTKSEVKGVFRAKWLIPLAIYGAAAAGVLSIGGKLTSYTESLWVKGISASIAACMALLGGFVYAAYIMLASKPNVKKRAILLCMSGVLLCESAVSFRVYFGNVKDVTPRFNQTMELSGKIEDNSFYRVKLMQRYFYTNMLEAMGFSSIGHYTSLTDGDFLFAAKRMGYSSYWLDSSTNGGTAVTDALMMNKYIFGQNTDMSFIYEPYNTEDSLKIYRNTIVSEGAVISDISPEELSPLSELQRADFSDFIAQKLYGTSDIMKRQQPYAVSNLEITESGGKHSVRIIDPEKEAYINYSFFAQGKQALYFDLFDNYSTALREPYYESVSVYINGKTAEAEYPNKRENGILDLGAFENKYVSVKISVHNDFSVSAFGLYSLDISALEKAVAETKTGQIALEGNKLSISAVSEGEQWLYIPFACSDGFSARVNGEKAELHRAAGSLMAVRLSDGENRVVLSYCPQGFAVGVVLSALGVLLFILLGLVFGKRRTADRIGAVSEKAVVIMSAAAFAVTFIIAPIAWIVLQFGF